MCNKMKSIFQHPPINKLWRSSHFYKSLQISRRGHGHKILILCMSLHCVHSHQVPDFALRLCRLWMCQWLTTVFANAGTSLTASMLSSMMRWCVQDTGEAVRIPARWGIISLNSLSLLHLYSVTTITENFVLIYLLQQWPLCRKSHTNDTLHSNSLHF